MEISGLYAGKPFWNTPLDEEQKTAMHDILAQYDPQDMSASERKQMRREMREAGIWDSREARELMREAGFGPGPEEQGLENAMAQGAKKGHLWDLYRQFQNGEISETDFLSLVKTQVQAGSLFTSTI